MKNAVLTLIILFGLSAGNLQAQAQDPALAVTQEAIDNFFAFDMLAYADAFSNDGILVNPYGMIMTGPETIYQAHLPVIESWKGLTGHATVANETVVHLNSEVSLVNVEVQTWFTNSEGETLNKLPAVVTSTIIKEDGQWRISAFHITPIVSPPSQG